MTFRTILAAGVAACVIGTNVPLANAQEEMSWTVDSYESDSPSEPSTIILHYGIPQTDAVGFEAVCGGPDGPVPQAVFWYDITELTEGDQVALTVVSDDFEDELPGSVYGKDLEVGVSGIKMGIDADAPVWTAMANGTELTYGLAGGRQEKLHIDAAAEAVSKFVSECQAMASTVTQEQSATAEPTDSRIEQTSSSEDTMAAAEGIGAGADSEDDAARLAMDEAGDTAAMDAMAAGAMASDTTAADQNATDAMASNEALWSTSGENEEIVAIDCSDDCEEDIGIIIACKGSGKPAEVTVNAAASQTGEDGEEAPFTIVIDGESFTRDARTVEYGMIGFTPEFSMAPDDPIVEALQAGQQRASVEFNGEVSDINLKGAREALDSFKTNCGWTTGVPQEQEQTAMPKLETGGAEGSDDDAAQVAMDAAATAGADQPLADDANAAAAMDAAASDADTPDEASSDGMPAPEMPSSAPTNLEAEVVSCDEFGTLKSLNSNSPLTVTFVNLSDGYRKVMWIDTKGKPIDYGGLNEGESMKLKTFKTHPWMFTDGPGNCIEMFVAMNDGNTMFEIKKPSPIFGDEEG